LRIVYMGSPALSVPSLEQLIANNYDVAAVYTQPDRPAGRGRGMAQSAVKEYALQHGIIVKQPETLKPAETLAELAAFKPEVIVVCAFGQILPQALLDIPPKQCVNVHFSLLPKHRGAWPVAASILAGDEFAGVSIQLVRWKLDTGPILASGAVPITDSDNTGTLAEKLSIIGAHLLLEALTGWERGDITPRPQEESASSYYGQVKKEEGIIDWHKPALEIWRQVRAFYPWPGCFTAWQGKQLKIIEARPMTISGLQEPGTVLEIPGESGIFGVVTGQGILGILKVQQEGKRAMTAAEFLRGQRGFIGAKLPG
jgi:methionyl-tRNA formyltransferase